MAFGIYDTEWVDLAPNVDRAYIDGLALGSGTTFESVLSDIDSMIGAFNIGTDPLLSALSYATEDAYIEYNMPTAFKIAEYSEYTMDRPQRGEDIGAHMLPIRRYMVATGWTEDGLREMSASSITNTVESILLGYRQKYRSEVMKRLFTTTEVAVQPRKTTATSPGFAGSGTGLNVYTKPYPNGTALPGGYTHYVRTDAAGLGAALVAAADKLQKQGHAAPYDIIAPQAVVDSIKLLSGFVATGSVLVRVDPSVPEALVDPSLYVGVYADRMRIRYAIDDFAETNLAVFKTYGSLDPRNALAIRRPNVPGLPQGAYLRSRNLFPLAEAEVINSWGVGVGDRTAAVLIHIDAAGSYDPPTFTI